MLPLVKRLETKTGKIFSIIIVLVLSLLLLSLLLWFIISQLTSLVNGLPDLEEKFSLFANSISSSLNDNLQISMEEQMQMLKEGIKNVSSYAGMILLSTSTLLVSLVQVGIYIFLFLLYRNRFKDFIIALNLSSDLEWTYKIQSVVRAYISGLGFVVVIAGALNSIGLLIIGIPHAIFFGFLSGLLTMIPYIGITIGATLPTLLALITKDNVWYAVGVIGVHAFVQFLEGNFITPKITGSKISINALAAIIALLIGGKIWGIAGMILSIPSIGIFKILASYSDTFKPLTFLLGDEEIDKKED
jgi:predicted PurR-regulated permease PerM